MWNGGVFKRSEKKTGKEGKKTKQNILKIDENQEFVTISPLWIRTCAMLAWKGKFETMDLLLETSNVFVTCIHMIHLSHITVVILKVKQ